ncbi:MULTISPECIES: hypothetical protein [unclassified Streptomyces]|uniref:hypothetical protein n=1 Tax=unclassified Streptomyces TaxID=2593676 RepID=UPI002E7FD22D|nr:hypothetical protein [Streptomyces sp. NBC_00589]WTI42320.1 hypothetical protein OIC96_49190 [Streptomyces sp. NBC_00775]WUB23998.1 hypothetical protein OHA51_00540 [Streptomyces sp. NBC_00589]
MSLDDNDYWQRWIARLLAVLAADPSDQLAWAGEHHVRTAAVADDAAFILHLAEGMAERGTLEPQALQGLKTIDRFFGEMAVRGPAGRWADALTADTAWSEVRTVARRILVARLGEWRLPLPRRVPPQHIYD